MRHSQAAETATFRRASTMRMSSYLGPPDVRQAAGLSGTSHEWDWYKITPVMPGRRPEQKDHRFASLRDRDRHGPRRGLRVGPRDPVATRNLGRCRNRGQPPEDGGGEAGSLTQNRDSLAGESG